jgi:TPR repeat protein
MNKSSEMKKANQTNQAAEADYRQGRELAFGLNGAKIDKRRGCELLTQAAEAGLVEAQAELAQLYLEGREGVAADAERARELALAAAQSENPFALDVLAELYKKGIGGVAKDEKESAAYYERAFRGFEKLSKDGDVRATNCLGFYYNRGMGVAKDAEKAVELYRRASDAGYVRATRRLAVCYKLGQGVA